MLAFRLGCKQTSLALGAPQLLFFKSLWANLYSLPPFLQFGDTFCTALYTESLVLLVLMKIRTSQQNMTRFSTCLVWVLSFESLGHAPYQEHYPLKVDHHL